MRNTRANFFFFANYLGHLGVQEFGSGLTSSEEVILSNINTETMKLLLQFTRSGGRVVGQEEEALVVLVQEVHQFLCARQKLGTLFSNA